MPGTAIINGFKGTLDFYVHCGINCVRSWPRSPGHDRAPAVQAQWTAFAWAASNWNNLTPVIQDAYRQLAQGTNATPRDLFMRSFINGTTLYLEDV